MDDAFQQDMNVVQVGVKMIGCYWCNEGSNHPVGQQFPGKCPPGTFQWSQFSQVIQNCANYHDMTQPAGPCGPPPPYSVVYNPDGISKAKKSNSDHGIAVDKFFQSMKAKYYQGREVRESKNLEANNIKEGSCGYTETPEGQKLSTPGGTKGMSADERTRSMMKKLIQKELKSWKKTNK